jgi:excisionase family DNA binding protein
MGRLRSESGSSVASRAADQKATPRSRSSTSLTVEEAAGRLGTSVRFVRRLIAERRIAYVKVGRHVRIAETDLASFVAAGRIEASA